jgi:hypothetical protein
MDWGLRLNGLGPGGKWDAPWGKMGYALGLNGLGLRLNGLGPGAKWDAPWSKKGCALGLNMLVPEAKWVMP